MCTVLPCKALCLSVRVCALGGVSGRMLNCVSMFVHVIKYAVSVVLPVPPPLSKPPRGRCVCLCERERESKRQFACVSRVRTETERQCRPIYSTILNCNQYTVRTIKCLVNRLINSHLIITTKKKQKNKQTPKPQKLPQPRTHSFHYHPTPAQHCAQTPCVCQKKHVCFI